MFDWIVEAVNVQLAKETTSTCLGVLDIYGFEIFEVRACVRVGARPFRKRQSALTKWLRGAEDRVCPAEKRI